MRIEISQETEARLTAEVRRLGITVDALLARFAGYARVSTCEQMLDSQLEQLRAAGRSSRNIYRGKVTGARAERRERRRYPEQFRGSTPRQGARPTSRDDALNDGVTAVPAK
jgi:Resolvase, N terminal domain